MDAEAEVFIFFFCLPVVVVAEPVADPDLELSGRGGEVFFVLLAPLAFTFPRCGCNLFCYSK